jgi:hypothetical protein
MNNPVPAERDPGAWNEQKWRGSIVEALTSGGLLKHGGVFGQIAGIVHGHFPDGGCFHDPPSQFGNGVSALLSQTMRWSIL